MDALLTGEVGKLMVGYRCAAMISCWSLTCQQDAIGIPINTLTGKVTSIDRYWIQQLPMVVGLWMGSVWWVWDRIDVSVVEGNVTIRVTGNPIAKHGL